MLMINAYYHTSSHQAIEDIKFKNPCKSQKCHGKNRMHMISQWIKSFNVFQKDQSIIYIEAFDKCIIL